MYLLASVEEKNREAAHHLTPVDALSILATDKNRRVRWHVSGNVSASPETLTMLASDVSADVRYSVAMNPAAPPRALAALANDPDVGVRSEARLMAGGRIAEAFAIDLDNAGAIDSLREQTWWEMDADNPAVVLAKTLFPDA